jgi:spheroidene monooxygenase
VDTTQPVLSALQGVVVVLLVDLATQHRTWGWLRLAQGAGLFKDVPGLRFVKVMGSGHGGGFGLRPSSSHQGLVCLFEHQDQAQAFGQSADVQAYMQRSREYWLGMLAVTSVRGQWDQQSWGVTPEAALQVPTASAEPGPIAALTRGTIRPAKALSFWRYAAPAQRDLQQAAGCQLAMGLGEAPLVRQCTFSVWDDTDAMVSYAHRGAHKVAIAAAAKHDYFSESMFTRMRVLSMAGTWQGRNFGTGKGTASASAEPLREELSHG